MLARSRGDLAVELRLDGPAHDQGVAEQVLQAGLEPADREEVLRSARVARRVRGEARDLAGGEVGERARLIEAARRGHLEPDDAGQRRLDRAAEGDAQVPGVARLAAAGSGRAVCARRRRAVGSRAWAGGRGSGAAGVFTKPTTLPRAAGVRKPSGPSWNTTSTSAASRSARPASLWRIAFCRPSSGRLERVLGLAAWLEDDQRPRARPPGRRRARASGHRR